MTLFPFQFSLCFFGSLDLFIFWITGSMEYSTIQWIFQDSVVHGVARNSDFSGFSSRLLLLIGHSFHLVSSLIKISLLKKLSLFVCSF